jgi:hypothetical protein
MKAACALVLLTVAGCATAEPRIVTREVKVPVPVACAPKLPAPTPYEADAVSLDGSVFDLVRSLLIDREQRKATEGELRAALRGCAG